ncbi:MAG: hypothetical protein U1D98_00785 [Candidatus Gracilibacteria bacterium]|nr:hypothetical protein [Candidatus Gracilibacteria bacterium]
MGEFGLMKVGRKSDGGMMGLLITEGGKIEGGKIGEGRSREERSVRDDRGWEMEDRVGGMPEDGMILKNDLEEGSCGKTLKNDLEEGLGTGKKVWKYPTT